MKSLIYTLCTVCTLTLYGFAANPTVQDKLNNASNAAVLVYGPSQTKGGPKVLIAYEPGKENWTIPGGEKKSNQTVYQAAATELFEETAAYPAFDPKNTLEALQNTDASRFFFTGYQSNTVTFCLRMPEGVDSYNINHQYKNRIADRGQDFHEMNQWAWVSLEELRDYFERHKNDPIVADMKKPGYRAYIGVRLNGTTYNIRNVAYRALQSFAKRNNGNFQSLINDCKVKAHAPAPSPKTVAKVQPSPTQTPTPAQPSIQQPYTPHPIAQVTEASPPPNIRAIQQDLAPGIQILSNYAWNPPETSSSLEMLNILRGSDETLLQRGPTQAEVRIASQALRTIANDKNVLANQLEYDAMVTSDNERTMVHQQVMWAAVNIMRDDRERDVLLAVVPPENHPMIQRLVNGG